MRALVNRLARLEQDGEYLTIGQIMDRLDSGERIDRVDPALTVALSVMEAY